ncbi:hypothetical protein CAEBREN_20207 [Caenorhabditis brenneri]|uniref:Uncharacterized protein n=1 Tax=Caenorhabditis brenneri TaxID=135651 RepID=G0MAF3_CAEBE|nr:hypothetical protein CAEBREN_20207 [Caenorhabditis brenneri]
MNKPPPGVYRKPYINLDALFGHPYSNVTGQPVSPSDVATFYLLRITFESHFGHRHMRGKQFSVQQKRDIFTWFYGLMRQRKEMTFQGYRVVVRAGFGSFRDIQYNWLARMESLGTGHDDVDLVIPDEFYTNKHSKDPDLDPNDRFHRFMERLAKDDLPFSSSFSYMYRWLKRILAQYAKMTTLEKACLSETMADWVNHPVDWEDDYYDFNIGYRLPYEISSSIRARHWLKLNMQLVDRNSHYRNFFGTILGISGLAQRFHPDVVEAFLMEAIVRVQQRDGPSAIKSFKQFFDASAFELNENMKHCMKTFRLAVPSQTPLRYAPILQARTCTMFEDYETARALLTESLQQAQLSADEICHQMGNVELHTLNIIRNGGVLENKTERNIDETNQDRRIIRKALKNIDDVHGHSRAGPCCEYTEEDFELTAELDSYGKMLMMLKSISEGTYKLKYGRYQETGLSCPVGYDIKERGIRVAAYGNAIMTSNMIRNGMYKQAGTASKEMITMNEVTRTAPKVLSEPYAIFGCNLAYSYAANGELIRALNHIRRMKRQFYEGLNWQGYRHIRICETILLFERMFMYQKWAQCRKHAGRLIQHSVIEYQFRFGLLQCAKGCFSEGVEMVKSIEVTDVRIEIRKHLQLASFHTASGHFEKTVFELDAATEVALATTLKDMMPLIKRRRATMLYRQRKFLEALELCNEIIDDVETYGTYIEKCCLYLTAAKSANQARMDPRFWIAKGKKSVIHGEWPAYAKAVYTELANLHLPTGLMPNRDLCSRACQSFARIHVVHPQTCKWLVI